MSNKLYWLKTYPLHTFNAYSYYLKCLYKETVYRVSVDGGFSCPHRGKDRNKPGCTYCDERGSRAYYLGEEVDLKKQIKGAISFLKKRYKAESFILYFQAFSGTYAAPYKLKQIYDDALSYAPFKEMIVSTRPDCINHEIAILLHSYKEAGLNVWVELGLQSASDTTLKRINRGHTVEDFIKAYNILKDKGISITIHIIFGLPGEGDRDILDTVRFVADIAPDGLKIHNLNIQKNTIIYNEYLKGELSVLSSQHHLMNVINALERIPAETVIMRLTCDTPKDNLIAPRNFWNKSRFYNELKEEMRRRDTWQGKLYKKA